MLTQFLLLMTFLGPGTSLQPWDTQNHGTKEAWDPVHLRGRRQVDGDDGFKDIDEDYDGGGTEPPEMLVDVTATGVTHPEPLSKTAVMEQRDLRGAGTPESATEKVATTEADTQWMPTTVEITIQPASTKAETLQPALIEAETSQPAPTEVGTPQPALMEAETSQPAPTEAETTQLPSIQVVETLFTKSTVTEAPPTETTAGKTLATKSNDNEMSTGHLSDTGIKKGLIVTSQPAPTEAETTQLPSIQAVETLFTNSTVTEAPPTETTAGKTLATKSNDNGMSTGIKKGPIVTPGSSVVPAKPGTSDLISVKQCLLAILILASLATIFLVCTVVLAVRLSRKNHMYPVRNYSPTEMICISSLLPEGGEGAPATANGGLPKAHDLKTESSDARDGDDLTLHSFLP